MTKMKFEVTEIEDCWQLYKQEANHHMVQEVSAGKVVNLHRPRVYTLEAFLAKLGLSRQAWSEYCKRPKFRAVTSMINEEVFARKKDAMVNGEGNTTGLIFDMKANYGINDKTVIDATIDGSIEVSLDLGGPQPNDNSSKTEEED